jgi:hypothetical protein
MTSRSSTVVWYATRYNFLRLIDETADESRRVTFAAGDSLELDKLPDERMLIVSRGHIRITRRNHGYEAAPEGGGHCNTVEVINAGEAVGSYFMPETGHAEPKSDQASAMDHCEAYSLPRAEAEQRAAACSLPPCDAKYWQAGQRKRIETPIAPMLFKSVEARVAELLLRFAENNASEPNVGPTQPPIRLANWQIADLAATNRDLVRCAIQSWEKRGWTERRDGRFVIVDPRSLLALSGSAWIGRTCVGGFQK